MQEWLTMINLKNKNYDSSCNIKLILLADDDADDCMFFESAIKELSIPAKIVTVHNGELAMEWLARTETLPDIIFLDINMPCKNGSECLAEIKQIERLQSIPVVIISTSLDNDIIIDLHKNGALFYIRKPSSFAHLKILLSHVVNLVDAGNYLQPAIEKFVLKAETLAI